jgi:succinyl-CoA synthetase beta subunit
LGTGLKTASCEGIETVAKLLEHQGKELLHRCGIPIPAGQVVRNMEEAQAAAEAIGYPLMIKAQIYAGKRGKSGGICRATDMGELTAVVSRMLGSQVRGHLVDTLLVERAVEVEGEIYAAVTADPSTRTPVMVVCAEGGVEIEEVAEARPHAVLKSPVDILRGAFPYDALNLLQSLPDLSAKQKLAVAQILCKLYEAYRRYDAKLVEINPLALVADGALALDARVDIDGDAVGRQTSLGIKPAEEAGDRSATLLEQIAATIDQGDHRGTVHFVQIDPDLSYCREHQLVPIGFDCVGAGVSLTMMDELVPLGFFPVNFCDSSGNPVASKLYRITKVIFSQPGIEGYVFVSCVSSQQLDNTARGIIKALMELYPETGGQPNLPTVLAFRGAWDQDALDLLNERGISSGKWIRVLGRDATERDVAVAFHSLYQTWKGSQGDVR